MKGSQRVSKAIHFEKPDRVPYIGYNSYYPLVSDVLPLFPLTPTSWQPPPGKYPHVHPMQLQFHLYKWKPMGFKVNPPRCWKKWKNTPHKEIDEWGVIWEEVGDGTMGWPVDGPLKSWEDLDNLKIPDGSDPARYSLSRKINKLVPKSWKYRLGLIDNFLFERTHFLRGWNRYMHDLVRNPQKIRELIKIILPYYEKMIRQLHEMGAQCVFTTDDWGTQEDVFISPRSFDKIFRAPYKKIVDLCHDLGMDFWLHSCGNVAKFLPKFEEVGIDVVEFDSPRMTGLDQASKFKGRLCFANCVDIQTVYPNGDPQDVEEEVLKMIKSVGSKNGGMIAIDYSQAHQVLNVPKDNIKAFRKSVKKYGKYDSDGSLEILDT